MAKNNLTSVVDTSSLKLESQNGRDWAEQQRTLREMVASSMEAIDGSPFVNIQDYLPGVYDYSMPGGGSWITTPSDREGGRDRPVFQTEQELRIFTGMARVFAEDLTIKAVFSALQNYVIGNGPTYQVTTKDKANQELVAIAQDMLEKFFERNRFNASFQRELFLRTRRDGECFLGLWHVGNGQCDIRTIDPVNVTQPANTQELDEYVGAYNPSSWTFGIHTDEDDVQDLHGIYVQWSSSSENWDYLPTGNNPLFPPNGQDTWAEQTKVNTDRNIKRGVSDLYACEEVIPLIRKLQRNFGEGAALQAAIAWYEEELAGITQSGVNNAIAGSTKQTGLLGGNGQPINAKYYPPGSIPKIQAGRKMIPGPMGSERATHFIGVYEALSRALATRWQIPEHIITGSAANNNFACHDSKTELLTKRGWLKHTEIEYGDEAATRNPITGRFEWQEITAIHNYKHSGEMVRFKGKHNLDILVTPNHRMFAARNLRSHKGSPQYKFIEAGKIDRNYWLPFNCEEKEATPIEMFELPPIRHARKYKSNRSHPKSRLIPMNTWLKYLGWWISEGWALNKGNPYSIGISQSQKQLAECADIRQVVGELSKSGLNTREHSRSNGMIAWLANDKSLWTWLRINCGTNSHTRCLPEFVFDLPASQQHIILDALIKGDGTDHKSGAFHYHTVSRKLADQVQSLALQCGYMSHVEIPMISGVIPVSIRPIIKRNGISKKHISRVPYKGTVWCVSVPNGLIITRRNGKAVVTGNSILVAGDPFVKSCECAQQDFVDFIKPICMKVLFFAHKAGVFGDIPWNTFTRLIKVVITPPPVAVRDKDKETARRKILNSSGILSGKTWSAEEELDYEQQQEEIKAEAGSANAQAISDENTRGYDRQKGAMSGNAQQGPQNALGITPKQGKGQEATQTTNDSRGNNSPKEQGSQLSSNPSVESDSLEAKDLGGHGSEKGTHHHRNKQAESPEFKAWFGDSKVIDEKGNPLVVYHGTNSDFDTFDLNKASKNDIPGFFFATREELAHAFGAKKIVAGYVNIKKPATFKDVQRLGVKLKRTSKIRPALIKEGFDGIYDPERGLVVAFNPNQIKSADNNRGTFNPQSSNINESDTLESYDESLHPRGDNGRWITKEEISAAKDSVEKAKELRDKVTDPEQRKKLNTLLEDTTSDSKLTLPEEKPNLKREVDLGDDYVKTLQSKIEEVSTKRDWSKLPTSFLTEAIAKLKKDLTPYFRGSANNQIKARGKLSKSETFNDLSEAIKLLRGNGDNINESTKDKATSILDRLFKVWDEVDVRDTLEAKDLGG